MAMSTCLPCDLLYHLYLNEFADSKPNDACDCYGFYVLEKGSAAGGINIINGQSRRYYYVHNNTW